MSTLDEQVAKLLGFKPTGDSRMDTGYRLVPLPRYSTSIAHAWELVEELPYFILSRTGRGWQLIYSSCGYPAAHTTWSESKGYICECREVEAKTAPEAICLAYCKVKEGNNE